MVVPGVVDVVVVMLVVTDAVVVVVAVAVVVVVAIHTQDMTCIGCRAPRYAKVFLYRYRPQPYTPYSETKVATVSLHGLRAAPTPWTSAEYCRLSLLTVSGLSFWLACSW